MKKTLFFLILSCPIACSSAYAMVNRDGKSFELVYKDHVKSQMKARGITEAEIALAIEYGDKSLNKKSNETTYNETLGDKSFAVDTRLSDQPNKLIINDLHQACSTGKKKDQKRKERKK